MSDMKINLRAYAQTPDVELSKHSKQEQLVEKTGTFGGRVMRQLKIWFGEERTGKLAGYADVKADVKAELTRMYGQQIANKVWQEARTESSALRDANKPIAGRHIQRMLAKADQLSNRELANWINDKLGAPEDGRVRSAKIGERGYAQGKPLGSNDFAAGSYDWMTKQLTDDNTQRITGQGKQHGFWIVELSSKDGKTNFQIPVHVDNAGKNVEIHGPINNYSAPTERFGECLKGSLSFLIPEGALKDIRSMALRPVEHFVPGEAKPKEDVKNYA